MPLPRLLACAFALLVPSACIAATITFNARQDISTGVTTMGGFVVADFNGDGRPDLAFTGYDKRVIVYLNNGTGVFGSPVSTTLTITNGAGSLTAGDVNEDGKQDLIVGTVSGLQANYVLLGKGDGTFTQNSAMPNSFGYRQGSLVDVNGDKHLDFVITGDVWLGDGKGNFVEKPLKVQNPSPLLTNLTVADFNRDDKPDLVISTYASPAVSSTGEMLFFAGVGDGTFAAPVSIKPFGNATYDSLGSADFNGDGKRDLAFALPVVGAIALGNGDGTFQVDSKQLILPVQSTLSKPLPGVDPPAVVIADFDGNGTPDIAFSAKAEKHLLIDLNDGSGIFPQNLPDFVADMQADFLIAADFNGDGLPDIVGSAYGSDTIQIFLSKYIKVTPTVALAVSPLQSLPGNAVTFSSKISGTNSTLTGFVAFYDGVVSLGQVALDANGQAAFTTSNLSVGQHSLTAAYSGDNKVNGAVSSAIVQSVVDFTLATTTATQTISPGGTAIYGIAVSGLGGLTATANISCSGLPLTYVCSSVTTSIGAQANTVNLTVVPAPHALIQEVEWPFHSRSAIALAAIPFALLLTFPKHRGRKGATLLSAISLSVSCAVLSGCSSSSSSTSTSTVAPYRGSTTFTINAVAAVGAQTISHQTTAVLTVQ